MLTPTLRFDWRGIQLPFVAVLWSAALVGCAAGRHRTLAPPISSHSISRDTSASGTGAVPAHFVDVTEKAGIHFHYERAATGKKYLVETMGAGCAFLDYDRDGWEDILLIQGEPLPGSRVRGPLTMKLYHNNRNGTFTDATHGSGLEVPMYGMGVAVGDYDNDGYPDIYVTAVLGPSHLFHNNRNGTFTDVTRRAGVGDKGMWGTSACWLDYDRDGYLDLFVCNYVRYRSLADDVPCYYQPGVRSYCIPRVYAGTSCRLYHNNHDGAFTDVTRKAGIQSNAAKSLAVAVCDINGDGWPDLVVANDTAPNFVYQNQRNGTFTEVGAASALAFGAAGNTKAGMGVDTADVTGSNKLAIAFANFWGESMAYYQQVAPGIFTESGDESGVAGASIHRLAFGTVFFDYDNDGFPDLMFACGHVQNDARMFQSGATYKEPQLLLHNDGNGRFTDVTQSSGPPVTDPLVGRGLAHGDFNNDGREDILITSNDGRVMLWQNQTAPEHHWLKVSLEGLHCNRDALGAELTVRAGGHTQHEWVRSGSSYLSASDHRVNFGLGNATTADLTVLWPDDRKQELSGVKADQILEVRES